MRISLKQLNDSYQALVRLGSQPLPKEADKLRYNLVRKLKNAKAEQDIIGEELNKMVQEHGLTPGAPSDDFAAVNEYNQRSQRYLKDNLTGEIWGDPIDRKDILEYLTISPWDEALLDWLIADSEEIAQKSATAAAGD